MHVHTHMCTHMHRNLRTEGVLDEGVLVIFLKVKIALSERYI